MLKKVRNIAEVAKWKVIYEVVAEMPMIEYALPFSCSIHDLSVGRLTYSIVLHPLIDGFAVTISIVTKISCSCGSEVPLVMFRQKYCAGVRITHCWLRPIPA